MPQPPNMTKAELREIILGDGDKDSREINSVRTLKVQFNPQTLKLNFSNQIKSDNQKGGSGMQFVGKGTTKLSLELWFDVTVPQSDGNKQTVNDVRKLTEKVKYFITPRNKKDSTGKKCSKEKCIPPGMRFIWGSFYFDGIMESMNESLEFFSDDGRPLRANVSISIVSQEIFEFKKLEGPETTNTPGTEPLQQVKAGDSVQKVAARTGQPDNWKSIASANNIENPRKLAPGDYLKIA